MNQPDRGYFQLQQAREVADVFAKHKVQFMFIGKGGAIILGYPAATQDVDLFPEKSIENGRRIVAALHELGFDFSEKIAEDIIAGADFVQLKQGPFDMDLVFAPDGINSFAEAKSRMILIDGFPVANIRDIIASKRAAGREKDRNDLPLLEDFQEEFEKQKRGEPITSFEIVIKRLENDEKLR